MKTRELIGAMALAACLAVPAFGADCATKAKADGKTIGETAASAGSFSTLLAAAEAAGLAETLSKPGPFTVFAPTDGAFEKLPEGTVDALIADPDQLRTVLLHHVVDGSMPASKVVASKELTSLAGQPLPVSTADGVSVDGSPVSATDIQCSNGVIHVIDAVMLPETIVGLASSNATFDTLVAAVGAAGLADTLAGSGPFTVFAPTNDAFAQLPDGALEGLLKPENKDQLVEILTAHVVPGHHTAQDVLTMPTVKSLQGADLEVRSVRNDGGELEAVYIDEAKIVKTDLLGSNGVIHVIDTVIMP